ncbi:hypothetical protein C8J55DRAFT_487221 [Lentinula edodes]|uniref:Uncharacterized protein n=1 Tax=Lentinula lateritia TaxID=40482 RepID=A0A9W9APT5_9AGAR|nr:hypothetical protein C8J55DRAFT_487221 [Lentinula edodes]
MPNALVTSKLPPMSNYVPLLCYNLQHSWTSTSKLQFPGPPLPGETGSLYNEEIPWNKQSRFLTGKSHANGLIGEQTTKSCATFGRHHSMMSIRLSDSLVTFEMVRGDGTKVEGVVKEKQEAKLFSISVRNIAAEESITINLKYVQALTDNKKKDQVKFIFPRIYAQ